MRNLSSIAAEHAAEFMHQQLVVRSDYMGLDKLRSISSREARAMFKTQWVKNTQQLLWDYRASAWFSADLVKPLGDGRWRFMQPICDSPYSNIYYLDVPAYGRRNGEVSLFGFQQQQLNVIDGYTRAYAMHPKNATKVVDLLSTWSYKVRIQQFIQLFKTAETQMPSTGLKQLQEDLLEIQEEFNSLATEPWMSDFLDMLLDTLEYLLDTNGMHSFLAIGYK